jgi:hypothetical protein
MKTRTSMLLIAAIALIALPAFAGPMKAGKWEMTFQMEMPGMPVKIPPVTLSKCVTLEEAENPQPPQMKKNDDCKIEDYKREGSTITWKMSCTKQKVEGTGKITYAADSYAGEMQMKMGEQEMSTKYAGKRVADDCK